MRGAWILLVVPFSFAGCVDDDASAAVANELPETLPLPDPSAMGALEVTRVLYDLGIIVGHDPELVVYQYPIQQTGSIHYPASGDGPLPLVVLMHGRHGTCAVMGIEGIGTHVCPSAVVVEPVDSFAGYDGLASNLASHGYVVASINANQINDRDLLGDAGANARAELVLATIDDLATVNASGGSGLDELQGMIDVSRIGLMGHSRGGEGVTRAITMNLARAQPLPIKAVFALAPTDFARWPAPEVAFATLLPYCDGDVFNLQGAWIYDDARELPGGPRYQVLAMGANHNFYNTVWTGDDWGTSGEWCGSDAQGSGRDSPEEQRAHGDALMASFFRLYVGQERGFARYWEGEAPWPASMCPKQETCEGRLLLSRDTGDDAYVLSRSGDGNVQDLDVMGCSASACGGVMYSVAQNSLYSWEGNGSASWSMPGVPGLGELTMRVGVPVGAGAVAMAATFIGVDGNRSVELTGHPALGVPPGGDNAKTVLSMVRVPLPEGWRSEDLRGVVLELRGSGAVHVADVMLQA
jgi:dienelactone hydrolase